LVENFAVEGDATQILLSEHRVWTTASALHCSVNSVNQSINQFYSIHN